MLAQALALLATRFGLLRARGAAVGGLAASAQLTQCGGIHARHAARQLAFDRQLLGAALERGLPVFGICYGMQLLAVCFGGKLLYHIPHDRPQAGEHQLSEADGRHGLIVEERTRLETLLGHDPGPVNSTHHQAVAEPGQGMRVCARSEDGLIEAIEPEASRFWIGVQWHPEKLKGLHRDALFGAFVAASTRRESTG